MSSVLLCVDGEPIRHGVTSIPVQCCRGLLEENLSGQSLMILLRDKCKLAIHRVCQRLAAQPDAESNVQLLHMERHAPIFVLESIYMDAHEAPIWMDVNHARANRVLFELEKTEERLILKNYSPK